MKMQREHYDLMKAKIATLKERINPHREYLIKEGEAKDIEKRLRWDLCFAAVGSKWICDNLYNYMNDDHIDTALRQIMVDLEAV